jgi:acetylglutamate kinase
MLTDVMGVLDKEKQLIPALSLEEVRRLMEDGTISGGMIPKLETCVDAVEGGVEAAVILDGRVPHALLLEIFTRHGVGTLVSRDGVD